MCILCLAYQQAEYIENCRLIEEYSINSFLLNFNILITFLIMILYYLSLENAIKCKHF